LYVTPVWWNYLIVSLYIPALIALVHSLFNEKNKYGKVRDEKKKIISNVIVGLKEDEFDKLVSKRVTDEKGEYRFVVDRGTYSVVVLNSDLKVLNEEKLSHINVKNKVMNIVCPNIVVRKLEDTAKDDLVEPLDEL
jgi:maltodextrin utilization protein YvdJ